MYLGCIADDFTGATDLANILVGEGLRTTLCVGVPEGEVPASEAVVIALKARTIPADEAVEQSLAGLAWLQEAGARQFFFKYCSTFDSTDTGNIGPVAEALLEKLGGGLAIVCPAFPENGRSVYKGHLFVGDQLLSESGMQHHPLTPMRDANLVRVLGRQVQGGVG
ncbi:MAG TPA: four-carbon acid sugar kinase family protein, partial [Candidatus Latescibacteria bacterium]|nr:four-carbon acid sugar kinase family protein [Candidatus Latescibacterota bacterium]